MVPATGREFVLEVTVQHREWRRDSTALILLFRDASEKRRIREEIRRADQLAFLGGMAARVAHEIRTPMATVRGLVELLQADLSETDTTRRQYIDRVLQAVDRQDRLVEDMLTLSHPEPESLQPVNVRELVDEVVRELPADPRLRVEGAAASALPTIPGDAFRLHEVFSNLIRNAVRGVAAQRAWWRCAWRRPIAGSCACAVRNTGVGIPADIRERIFHPFFTTKIKGTGLGLAIAKHIVDAHRGTLRVESDGRHGDQLRGGASDNPAHPRGARSKVMIGRTMAERILIAEDDEDLAFVLREALIRKDYEVEVAPTAGRMLDTLKGGAWDLILLDVRLPDMDGLDAIPSAATSPPTRPSSS